jgi:hypothetical protein
MAQAMKATLWKATGDNTEEERGAAAKGAAGLVG